MLDGTGARIASLVDGTSPRSGRAVWRRSSRRSCSSSRAEYWLRAIPKWGELGAHYDVLLAVATVACVAASRAAAGAGLPRSRRGAPRSRSGASSRRAATTRTSSSTSACSRRCCAPTTRPRPRSSCAPLRWLAVIVLFYSGVQKLAHGYWSNGEYLAFALGSDTYRALLGWLLPDAELARLARLRGEVGDGPYRVASGPLLVALECDLGRRDRARAGASSGGERAPSAMTLALLAPARDRGRRARGLLRPGVRERAPAVRASRPASPARVVSSLVLLAVFLVRLGCCPT